MRTPPPAMDPILSGTVSPSSTISSNHATTSSARSLSSTTPSSPVLYSSDSDLISLTRSQDGASVKRKWPFSDEDSAPTSTRPARKRLSVWTQYIAQSEEFAPEIPHGITPTPFQPFTEEQDAAHPFPTWNDAYPKQSLKDIVFSDDEDELPKRKMPRDLHQFTQRAYRHHAVLLETTEGRIATLRKMPTNVHYGRLDAALLKKAYLESLLDNPPPPSPQILLRAQRKHEAKRRRAHLPHSTEKDGLIRDKLPARIKSIFFNFLQARKRSAIYSNPDAHRDLSMLLLKLQASRKSLAKTYKPRNTSTQPTLPVLDALLLLISTRLDAIKSCTEDPVSCTATHAIEPLRASGIDNGPIPTLKFANNFRLDRLAAALGVPMLSDCEAEQFHISFAPANLWIAHLQLCESLDSLEQMLKAAKAPKGRPVPKPKRQVLRLAEDRHLENGELPWVYWEEVGGKKGVVSAEVVAIEAIKCGKATGLVGDWNRERGAMWVWLGEVYIVNRYGE